jgi:hypothetical protein
MRHDQGGSLIRMWADAPLAIRKAGDVPRCARGIDSLLIDAATCPKRPQICPRGGLRCLPDEGLIHRALGDK